MEALKTVLLQRQRAGGQLIGHQWEITDTERMKLLTFEQEKKAVVNSNSCTSRSNTKLVSTANSANSKHSKEDFKDVHVHQDHSKLLLAL